MTVKKNHGLINVQAVMQQELILRKRHLKKRELAANHVTDQEVTM